MNTCDNENFPFIKINNLYMYVKFSLIVEYDLLENDRKMNFSEKNPILSILGVRRHARTDVMVFKINSLIIVE